MAKKGSAEERDLVHKLWDRNFALLKNHCLMLLREMVRFT